MKLEWSPETEVYHAESLSPPCVPTILHINHESRTIGLSIFRNTFGDVEHGVSDVAEKRTYWNPAIDTLYLPDYNPPSRVRRDMYDSLESDDEDSDPDMEGEDCKVGNDIYRRHNILPYVRHIALSVVRTTARVFDPDNEERNRNPEEGLVKWLEKSFPELESVTMLIDPYPEYFPGVEILLHELEGEVERWNGGFAVFRRAMGGKWDEEEGEWVGGKLGVEMLVISLKKTKRAPAFCVRRNEKVGVWGTVSSRTLASRSA